MEGFKNFTTYDLRNCIENHISKMVYEAGLALLQLSLSSEKLLKLENEEDKIKGRKTETSSETPGQDVFKYLRELDEESLFKEVDILLNSTAGDIFRKEGEVGLQFYVGCGVHYYFSCLKRNELQLVDIQKIWAVDEKMYDLLKFCFAYSIKEPDLSLKKSKSNKSALRLKEKKITRWEEVLPIMKKHKEEIYAPGFTLNKILNRIYAKLSTVFKEPPDKQTIKRYLEEYENITSKNVDQIWLLLNRPESS